MRLRRSFSASLLPAAFPWIECLSHSLLVNPSQFDDIFETRQHRLESVLLPNELGECLPRTVFLVRHHHPRLRRGDDAEPLEQVALAGMGAESTQGVYQSALLISIPIALAGGLNSNVCALNAGLPSHPTNSAEYLGNASFCR